METIRQKGFTLIELLVVIAILAVLAVAVILVLNPAELIRQGRDSTRLSDTRSLVSAINLFLADGQTLSVAHNCTVGIVSPISITAPIACLTNATTNVTGTGWVPLNFTTVSTGSPLPALPIDPKNDATYYYAFKSTTAAFEIDANMESVKFTTGGASDVESNAKDGGNNATWYEVGNAPGLAL